MNETKSPLKPKSNLECAANVVKALQPNSGHVSHKGKVSHKQVHRVKFK